MLLDGFEHYLLHAGDLLQVSLIFYLVFQLGQVVQVLLALLQVNIKSCFKFHIGVPLG